MNESFAMRITHVLLMSAVSVTACALRGPDLRQPVGQTMTAPSPPRDAAGSGEAAAPPANAAEDAELYLTGKSTGPCRMDPLPMITFAFGATRLSEPQTVELRRLAECVTAAPYETTSVVLVGYADVVGTVPANLTLGLERAQSVMRQLIDSGVSPARIVVASAGELQRPNARWGLQADRVEILIARGGPPRPEEAPITRGIDAEGLLPRPRPPVVSGGSPGRIAPPQQPPFMPRMPPRSVTPLPRPRSR